MMMVMMVLMMMMLWMVLMMIVRQGEGEGGDDLHPGAPRDRLAEAEADRGQVYKPGGTSFFFTLIYKSTIYIQILWTLIDKCIIQADLKRKLGQLSYLQSLKTTDYGKKVGLN